MGNPGWGTSLKVLLMVLVALAVSLLLHGVILGGIFVGVYEAYVAIHAGYQGAALLWGIFAGMLSVVEIGVIRHVTR